MKYSKFEDQMKVCGLSLVHDNSYIIAKLGSDVIGRVSKAGVGILDTDYRAFFHFGEGFRKELLQVFTKLANTPLDEREEEKKYYVKFMERVYLVYYPKSRNYGVVSTREGAQEKTQFTEQEIKNYDSRYWAFAEEVKEDE